MYYGACFSKTGPLYLIVYSFALKGNVLLQYLDDIGPFGEVYPGLEVKEFLLTYNEGIGLKVE